MLWTYEINSSNNGVRVFLDGKQYTSINHSGVATTNLSVNALKSIRFLYGFGNELILDETTTMESSIALSLMIQRAVSDLLATTTSTAK